METVTLTIDGRQISVPKGTAVLQAAIESGIQVPYYCYHPGLGIDASCRVCLVKIEKMPKLQTSCSTPVAEGMVVHTRDAESIEGRASVFEFLLINHPLDCPVCDKGGECPLQDITYGWGPGTSRFIEPKRHFKKPLELSPVGALTSRAYRFRARPWDIEGAGTVCAGCPAQCNVELTVRDERVLRVLARDHDEVDDGWLCDKGRFSYQAIHADERVVTPLVREGA